MAGRRQLILAVTFSLLNVTASWRTEGAPCSVGDTFKSEEKDLH